VLLEEDGEVVDEEVEEEEEASRLLPKGIKGLFLSVLSMHCLYALSSC
jgi:DNA-directed RNA polymerase alpha subunit